MQGDYVINYLKALSYLLNSYVDKIYIKFMVDGVIFSAIILLIVNCPSGS